MSTDPVSDLSYADTLWKSADALRGQVEMLEPYAGRVYDPACGSGGMFVQSEKFAEAHDLRSKTGDAI